MYSTFENETAPRKTFKNKEEWHQWVNAMAGCITDETFVEPPDAYFDDIGAAGNE